MSPPVLLPPDNSSPPALVVFGGHCELPWLRLLKPGFRHCFLLRRVAAGWLLYDPRSDMTELSLWPPCSAKSLYNSLINKGYIVAFGVISPPLRRAAPLAPFTCVEAVKRGLGIRRRWVLTPWQLYRHLICEAGMRDGERKGKGGLQARSSHLSRDRDFILDE